MARAPRSRIPPSVAGLPAWWGNIQLNDKGNPKAITLNGDVAVSSDVAFVGAIRFDKFRGQTLVCAPLPWDQHWSTPRQWEDNDDYLMSLWLQELGLIFSSRVVHEIVESVARRNQFHPVMDFFYVTLGGINNSIWDGTPRVGDDNTPSWLTYYLGVPDTPLVRAIGPRWMISAVSRPHDPGNQADCCLVLEGKTGLGKSTTFKILGSPWYTNDIAALNTKDAKEQMAGAWIIELDELDAITRAGEWTTVISFVSRSTDRFRFSYGRRVLEYRRHRTRQLDT